MKGTIKSYILMNYVIHRIIEGCFIDVHFVSMFSLLFGAQKYAWVDMLLDSTQWV
jgi:uncharacterized membrane protein YeiB